MSIRPPASQPTQPPASAIDRRRNRSSLQPCWWLLFVRHVGQSTSQFYVSSTSSHPAERLVPGHRRCGRRW